MSEMMEAEATTTNRYDLARITIANDIKRVPALAAEISTLVNGSPLEENDDRLEVLRKAKSLVRALETPREMMLHNAMVQPTTMAAVAFSNDIGLFKLLAMDAGSPKKVSQMAETLGVDSDLLSRMLRHAASMEYIAETGVDEYAPTPFSTAMSFPEIAGAYFSAVKHLTATYYKLPEYLKSTGFLSPNDASNGPFQYAFNTPLPFFAYLAANPPLVQNFGALMGIFRLGRADWLADGFYPVKERLIDGLGDDPDAVLLVDVGGNTGHDISDFQRRYPDAPGRLILQDLPEVIESSPTIHERIEKLPYDFFTEQPIKGARAYYLHSILHDWPTTPALAILSHIKAAMKPGYSRLLVNENVLPMEGAGSEATGLDIAMLALMSGRERTEGAWRELLEDKGAGLRVVRVWRGGKDGKGAGDDIHGVIECERVE